MKSTSPQLQSPDLALNPHKWLVFAAVGIGTFMSALDGSVVNTILPVIRSFFQSDISGVEWIVVVYLLVVSSLLLLFGRLGDLYGNKRIYVGGFVIFILSSAACGLASSVAILVLSRGVQALGAAMLFSNSPAILTKNFPPQQRGQALGMQATMTYLGLSVGPSLGGWLTQTLGWRSVFYINVPIGLLAFGLSLAYIRQEKSSATRGEPFDWWGAVLFSLGLVALLFGLNNGESWSWTSPGIVGSLLAALVFLVVFVRVETRAHAPMLDLSLFRVRLFSASTGSAMMNYIAQSSVIFLMPFYLIQGRGLNPAEAGLILSSQPIIMAISAPISGLLSDRIGSRVLSTAGLVIMAFGLFLLSRLEFDTALVWIVFALVVEGLGTGVFISPNNSALLGSAPRHRQGIASGILATARNVGMVLGIGLAGAVLAIITSHQGDAGIYSAVQLGFLIGAGIALLGAFISFSRGNEEKS